MLIIDGKKIAEEIKSDLKKQIAKIGKKLKLAIVFIGDDKPTRRFIELKRKFAKEIGVETRVYNLSVDISVTKLRAEISKICHIKENTGVIVQLPLPIAKNSQNVDAGKKQIQYVLNGIISKKDVDVLSSQAIGNFVTGRSKILPPVVGAMKEIMDRSEVSAKGKNVVVIGTGMLVGKPVVSWFINQGATVSVLNKSTADIKQFTLNADIIVTGAGQAKIITVGMVKDGVVIIDAGTSVEKGEEKSKLVGDVDPAVEEKASVFTPVPGGVGPITVAMIFRNLLELAK